MNLIKTLIEEFVTGHVEYIDFANRTHYKASCKGWDQIEDTCECGETNVELVRTDFGTLEAKGKV